MKITRVEPIVLRTDHVDVTRADGTQDAFVVRVHTDEGLVGVGEADTSPYVARTMIEMPSSHSLARGLAEVLVGEDPIQIQRRWDDLYRGSYHYGRFGAALHVISGIDIALWDLAGKAAGLPVSELLGGRRLHRVPCTPARSCRRPRTRCARSPRPPWPAATARSSWGGGRSDVMPTTTWR